MRYLVFCVTLCCSFVVSLILIGRWTAVKEYWLNSSAGSERKSESISKIAETVPVAAAVAQAKVSETKP